MVGVDQSSNGRLLKEIKRISALQASAQARVDHYRAELLPLVDKALTGDPQHPLDRMSLRTLAPFTCYHWAALGKMVANYRRDKQAHNDRGTK